MPLGSCLLGCNTRGTNNVAELVGIETACSYLTNSLSSCILQPKIHIFIDNQYAIRAADSYTRVRANRRQVKLTRDALASLRNITTVTLHWVPGHAGIPGNELADRLAKRGASGITSHDLISLEDPSPSIPASRVPQGWRNPACLLGRLLLCLQLLIKQFILFHRDLKG